MNEKAIKIQHPLMPAPLATRGISRFLRRTHAWVGITTVILAFIFAWSGFMLNHRANEDFFGEQITERFTIPAPVEGFESQEQFALFLKQEFDLRGEAEQFVPLYTGAAIGSRGAQAPAPAAAAAQPREQQQPASGDRQQRADGADRQQRANGADRQQPEGTADRAPREQQQATSESNPARAPQAAQPEGRRRAGPPPTGTLQAAFVSPNNDVVGTWREGSDSIDIVKNELSINRVFDRLHVGRGPGSNWDFVIDGYAVMMLLLSLTGILLWSRVSGSAKVGGSILGGVSAAMAFWLFAM